jgi:hypothetical protein
MKLVLSIGIQLIRLRGQTTSSLAWPPGVARRPHGVESIVGVPMFANVM